MDNEDKSAISLEQLVSDHARDGKGSTELARALMDAGLCEKYRPAVQLATQELRRAYSSARAEGKSPSYKEVIASYHTKGVAFLAGVFFERGFFETVEEARKMAQYEALSHNDNIHHKSTKQSEVLDRKEWRYTGDKRNNSAHCRNHAKMDRVLIPKDQPFELTGLDGEIYYPMYPRDPILPECERLECKCFCQYIVADDVLGLSYEERRALQDKYIAEVDGEWEKELNAKNRAKAGFDTPYIEKNWGDIEPYTLLAEMNELLDSLENAFDLETESKICETAETLLPLNHFSTYQLSLAIKRLADCYYANDLKEKTLSQYHLGLKLNPKLPVKRKVKELDAML